MKTRPKPPDATIVLRPSEPALSVPSDARATLPQLTKEDAEEVNAALIEADAPNTRRTYESHWRVFAKFCEGRAATSLPAHPLTVALYIKELAKGSVPDRRGNSTPRRLSTIKQHLAAISVRHARAGLGEPTKHPDVKRTLKGVARTIGTPPVAKKAVSSDSLKQMVETLPVDLRRVRDTALLLVGFFGAFRRSELVSLQISDVEFEQTGMTILLRRSKTDQEGAGHKKWFSRLDDRTVCPCTAVERQIADLRSRGFEGGPLFRKIVKGKFRDLSVSDYEVAAVVKAGATRAGLDPTVFAGHSLRSGFATAAKRAGADVFEIKEQTGHKSLEMVARYVQHIPSTDNHATKRIFK